MKLRQWLTTSIGLVMVLVLAGCSSENNESICGTDKDCPWPQACIDGICVGGDDGGFDGGSDGGDGGGDEMQKDCDLDCPGSTSCIWDAQSLRMYCEDSSGNKVGPGRTYDENGNLFAEYSYNEDGQQNGDVTLYFEDGSVAATGHFTDGEEDGVFTSYYRNGEKESELTYVDGELEGPTRAWWPNNNLRYEGQYLNGLPSGPWIYYYESGNKEKEESYLGGILCGAWVSYYDDLSLCPDRTCQIDQQGARDGGFECGPWQCFWENGNPKADGSYFGVSSDGDALRCGPWTEYDQSGQVVESPPCDACPVGIPLCGNC